MKYTFCSGLLLALLLACSPRSAPISPGSTPRVAGTPTLGGSGQTAVLTATLAAVNASPPGPAQDFARISTPGPKPAPTVAPVPAVSDPKLLAERVYKAADASARYQALLDVMRALAIGVVDEKTGQAVVKTAKQGVKDLYLYDFEVKILANGLNRERLFELDQVSTFINAGLEKVKAEPIKTAQVRGILLTAVRSSVANPSDRYSLPYLLVREFGLRHADPYDLLQDVPEIKLRLDPLQLLVLDVDAIVSAAAKNAASDGNPSFSLVRSLYPRRKLERPAQQGEPCADLGSASGTLPFGKWTLGLLPPADIVLLLIDELHGVMMSINIGASALDGPQETHYGHESPGKEMRFRIKVEMLDDYGPEIVKCGVKFGFQIPPKGGIPGVEVKWDTPPLNDHGTFQYDPPDKTTNAEGIATLIFKPKDEKRPGQGPNDEKTGTLSAIPLFLSALGNAPGSLSQYIGQKNVLFSWTVKRHLNVSLKIAFQGSGSTSTGTITWVRREATIPLEGKEYSLQGSYSGTFTAIVVGECSGNATYPVTFDVTATGIDPLNFDVKTTIGMSMTGRCGNATGSVSSPPKTASLPPFSLPLKAGASKTIESLYPNAQISIILTLLEE